MQNASPSLEYEKPTSDYLFEVVNFCVNHTNLLMKMAHADSTLPFAALAQASNVNDGHLPSTSLLIDSEASDHMMGNPYSSSLSQFF